MDKCKCTEHHQAAADHHEKAARHHREAAKQHEAEKYEQAGNQAHLARGYQINATHHADKACKLHLTEHAESGKKSKAKTA